MRNVLLMVPPASNAPKAISRALATAKALGGSLLALVVLDPDTAQRVASALANIGWVGDKVSAGVVDTLAQEQRAQAEAFLGQIAVRARAEGVPFVPLIEEGDPSEVCSRILQAHRVTAAVLVSEKRSWLTRFLSRSAAVSLPALAGCEVTLMEED